MDTDEHISPVRISRLPRKYRWAPGEQPLSWWEMARVWVWAGVGVVAWARVIVWVLR
jgi:hypothetical protein